MNDVETRQAKVVGVAVVVFTREPQHTQVQQMRVPMTAQQAMSLLNFVKHRLHGGRLTLESLHGAPQPPQIITPP